MTATGWVIRKGNAGDVVPEGTAIYTAKSLITTIRAGSIPVNPAVDNAVKDYINDAEAQSSIQQAITTGDYSAITDAVNDYTQSENDTTEGAFTGTPIQIEQTEIEKQTQEKITELDKMSNQMNNISFTQDAVTAMTKWFDDMDEFLDSLPEYGDVGEYVYEVEQDEDDPNVWYYTGVQEYADTEWNASINAAKGRLCQKLNDFANDTTNKITAWTSSNSVVASKCKPFMAVIQAIQKAPSIDTIVGWAKSVIEFITGIYKFIYDTYVNVMTIMEILVVRFPLLISKIVQKVSQYDCPINIRTTSVTIKSPKK